MIAAADCRSCAHRQDAVVFELCDHPTSEYAVAGKADLHTVGHMRRHECGHEARNFTPLKTVLGS